ncbi:hypothetical protein [Streptomyces sp. NBRC 109706]|uniref:hypothetical protein n=1 Tax=Streptomyces sp. NBRC 109706 TaxID=1550035 RepID=UPI000783C12B|nr:hypothetical protein [Streptomyces sp. NBRC 109706]
MSRYAYRCGACQARDPWRRSRWDAWADQDTHRANHHGGMTPDGDTILVYQEGPTTGQLLTGIVTGIGRVLGAIADAWRRSPLIRAIRVELGRTRWWKPTIIGLRLAFFAWVILLLLKPEWGAIPLGLVL